MVVGLVLHQPDMYLREICQCIQSTFAITVSEPTVCRILRRHGLTRKKIRHEALQRSSLLRGRYLAEMTIFHADQLVWIDETGCRNKDSIRLLGYALRGMTPVRSRLMVRGKRLSCIAAMDHNGMVALETTYTTVDAQIFFDFVRGCLIPNMLPFDGSSPRSVAIMDNCSIHHTESVKELFRQAGILLIFLPPYSPDLTPVELLFAKVKRYLKENDELIQHIPDTVPIIKAAFETINPSDCHS